MIAEPNVSTPGSEKQVLLILPRMHGFFSLVFQAVGQAYLAEKAGQSPVVYFNRRCLYWSDAGYNGARNVWEYFFEPLSDITIDHLFPIEKGVREGYSVDEFAHLSSGTRVVATNRYPFVIEYKSPIGVCFERRFVNRLLNKYLIFKPSIPDKASIPDKVDDYCRAHFQSRPILGVHYRGVEKLSGREKDELISRRAPDLKEFYFREMRRYMRKHPSARIFVATDSEQFLGEAAAAFGRAVFFREATRLKKEEEVVGLHFSEQAKLNGPRLAEEVLLDALLLARTDFLIHGISNVSNAALFFSPQLRHTDIEVRYGRTKVYLRREFYRLMKRWSPGIARQVERLENFIRF